MVHRVGVLPAFRGQGLAGAMVRAVALQVASQGMEYLQLTARAELPEVITWWQRNGFEIAGPAENGYLLRRSLPLVLEVPTAPDMQQLGVRLAGILQPGDVIMANGELGAGKTTLTQGIGAGLNVTGSVISPTFVLSRIHRARTDRPQLVHVDAYRLDTAGELEDLDLEATLGDSVTVIEWGQGLAERLSESRLEIDIERHGDDSRTVLISGIGPRWADRSWMKGLGQEAVND
jgi:tRNA threonylcarbamoyladenosine biosynthesis protein TsaE